jgi:hypothetical protein
MYEPPVVILGLDVNTTKYMTSLQVRSGLASKASAIAPDIIGQEALVPPNPYTHNSATAVVVTAL